MLDPRALERHLKTAHSHFAEGDLFLDTGERATGFFLTKLVGDEENRVPENIRYFRSPTRQPLNTRITDRKKGVAWRVKYVEGEDGAFIHTMETTPAA